MDCCVCPVYRRLLVHLGTAVYRKQSFNAKMEDKNKKLALKNLQLKTEIDKLTACQTSLMRENIKVTYYSNRTHRKMAEILDENLKCIERAYENTLKLKREMLGDFVVDGDGELPESRALVYANERPCEGQRDSEKSEKAKPLSDKSNVVRQKRKSRKVFNKKSRSTVRRKK